MILTLPAWFPSRKFSPKSKISIDFQLQNFVAKHHKEMGAAYRAAFQALEKTRANMKWMKQNYKQIVQWLKSALVQIRSRKKAQTSLALHAGLQL